MPWQPCRQGLSITPKPLQLRDARRTNYGTSWNGRFGRSLNVRYVITMNRRIARAMKTRIIVSFIRDHPPFQRAHERSFRDAHPTQAIHPQCTGYWAFQPYPANGSSEIREPKLRTVTPSTHTLADFSQESIGRDQFSRRLLCHGLGSWVPSSGEIPKCTRRGAAPVRRNLPHQTVITFVASAQCRARSGAEMNVAFFPRSSPSVMPRARAQPSQT